MPTEEVLNHLDASAMYRHERHASASTHAILAEKIWGALRDLGVARGRMLVTGLHAATLTGLLEPGRASSSRVSELVAPIPPVGWPHQGLRPEVLTADHPARYDVVIANPQYADLHFRSRQGAMRVRQNHEGFLASAVERTFPGGIVVAVATRHLLDHPSDAVRRFLLTQQAQLLGAVRVPGTTLRPGLSVVQASPLDLIVLRRPLPGETLAPALCLSLAPVSVLGGVEQINEFYARHHPDHVIGLHGVVADPDRNTPRYVVELGNEPWDSALETRLSRITSAARTNGLTATSASWTPPESWPAPQADWPVRAITQSASPPPRLDPAPRSSGGPGL